MIEDVPGLDHVIERLTERFKGYFSAETIRRYVEESEESLIRSRSLRTSVAPRS
jgi:hypothetical protein